VVEEFVEEEEEVAEEEEEGNPKGCARLSQAVLCPSVSLSNSAHTLFCAPASTAIPDPLPHTTPSPSLRASAAPFHPTTVPIRWADLV